MKMIRYDIPNFIVRNEMSDYVASHPAMSRDEAITEWMVTKYKAWIETHINPVVDFVANIEPTYFDVTFADVADATTFLSTMGGREY